MEAVCAPGRAMHDDTFRIQGSVPPDWYCPSCQRQHASTAGLLGPSVQYALLLQSGIVVEALDQTRAS